MLKSTAADPSMWTDWDQAFGVVPLHQLHCVVRISFQLRNEFVNANSKGSLKHACMGFEKTRHVEASASHTNHCIEILRQVVICAGDLTREGLSEEGLSSVYMT